MLTAKEKAEITDLVNEGILSFDDLKEAVENVLSSNTWCWKKGEWGYAQNPFLSLVKGSYRATVDAGRSICVIRIMDLTGLKEYESFSVSFTPAQPELSLSDTGYWV